MVSGQRRLQIYMVRRHGAVRGRLSFIKMRFRHCALLLIWRQLFREDCTNKPVAAFHKERRFLHVLRISQYPYLEIDASTIDTLDYLVGEFPPHP